MTCSFHSRSCCVSDVVQTKVAPALPHPHPRSQLPSSTAVADSIERHSISPCDPPLVRLAVKVFKLFASIRRNDPHASETSRESKTLFTHALDAALHKRKTRRRPSTKLFDSRYLLPRQKRPHIPQQTHRHHLAAPVLVTLRRRCEPRAARTLRRSQRYCV